MSGTAIGIVVYTYPAFDWSENPPVLITGGDYYMKEGSNTHNLTEIGSTGLYDLPAGMVGGTDYTVWDNGTGATKKLANGDDEIYKFLDPTSIQASY